MSDALRDVIGHERRFCCWGPRMDEVIVDSKGKIVSLKAPISHNSSHPISWAKPAKWLTLAQARDGVAHHGRQGIGMFTSSIEPECAHLTQLAAMDFDHCVQDGVITAPWVQALVEHVATHSRISPSGTGLHLWFLAVPGFVAPVISSHVKDHTGQVRARGYECYSFRHHVRMGKTVYCDNHPRYMTEPLWTEIAALLPGWLAEQAEKQALVDAAERERAARVANSNEPATCQTPSPAIAGQLSEAQVAHVAKEYNSAHTVADELKRHHYTVTGDAVTRPNKDAKDGHSGNIKDGVYCTFSANDDLPITGKGEHGHTAFSVFAHFDHGGDEQAAAWAAAAELGIELHVPMDREIEYPIDVLDVRQTKYVLGTVNKILAEVSTATDAAVVARAAKTVGRIIHCKYVKPDKITDALVRAGIHAGLSEDVVRDAVLSGISAGVGGRFGIPVARGDRHGN